MVKPKQRPAPGKRTTGVARGRVPKGQGSLVIYENLRRRILDLELEPGSVIEEEKIVDYFGISRTPVREAFLRLWADGLVVLLPNRGARVAPLEVSNLRQFFEALELCQRACTYWAALRATPPHLSAIREELLKFEAAVAKKDGNAMAHSNLTFHNAIGTASGNIYIASAYDRILREGMRISKVGVTYEFDPGKSLADHLERIVQDHREMLSAIERRDSVHAEELGASHAKLARLRTTEALTATLGSDILIPDSSTEVS